MLTPTAALVAVALSDGLYPGNQASTGWRSCSPWETAFNCMLYCWRL